MLAISIGWLTIGQVRFWSYFLLGTYANLVAGSNVLVSVVDSQGRGGSVSPLYSIQGTAVNVSSEVGTDPVTRVYSWFFCLLPSFGSFDVSTSRNKRQEGPEYM